MSGQLRGCIWSSWVWILAEPSWKAPIRDKLASFGGGRGRDLRPGKLLQACKQWWPQRWCCTGGSFTRTGWRFFRKRRAKNGTIKADFGRSSVKHCGVEQHTNGRWYTSSVGYGAVSNSPNWQWRNKIGPQWRKVGSVIYWVFSTFFTGDYSVWCVMGSHIVVFWDTIGHIFQEDP